MARRGFFAELQHQARMAERERLRLEREGERARRVAAREAEQERKAKERAAAQRAKASAAEQKRLEKEAKEAHIAAMEAEVAEKNQDLARFYGEVDSLLAATLDVDDFVDLESLKQRPVHPPYANPDLETAVAAPDPLPPFSPPPPPTGLKGLFGKKKHELAIVVAQADYDSRVAEWNRRVEKHKESEEKRLQDLAADKAKYAEECEAREQAAKEHNESIDKFIADLGYGVTEAVQEYVAIVLSSSVYPSDFSVSHDFTFDPETAELKLRVGIPSPDKIPDVAEYKYTKSSDEITEKKLTAKACKDRYASIVHQVALRSIHEVFEADRRGLIRTISLEVGTETINPATGISGFILFVAVGAERESFIKFDLANVVPLATLNHLGASVSKNPHGLEAADSSGIRKS